MLALAWLLSLVLLHQARAQRLEPGFYGGLSGYQGELSPLPAPRGDAESALPPMTDPSPRPEATAPQADPAGAADSGMSPDGAGESA